MGSDPQDPLRNIYDLISITSPYNTDSKEFFHIKIVKKSTFLSIKIYCSNLSCQPGRVLRGGSSISSLAFYDYLKIITFKYFPPFEA